MNNNLLVTIGGPPGSGTSTLANILKEKLQLQYEYAGAFFRNMAKERKMSLEDFGIYASEHLEIDKDLDARMLALARKPGRYLLEGRMIGALVSRQHIPAIKVWIDASIDIRVQRLITRDHFTQEEAIRKIESRDNCDKKRYMDLYGINPYNEDCYDLKLISDNLTPDQLANKVIHYIHQNLKEKTMTAEMTTPAIQLDALAEKFGGMFALVTLINLRTREIKRGARPLVNDSLKDVKSLVIKEIAEGKISLRAADTGDAELVYETDDEFFLED